MCVRWRRLPVPVPVGAPILAVRDYYGPKRIAESYAESYAAIDSKNAIAKDEPLRRGGCVSFVDERTPLGSRWPFPCLGTPGN